MLEAVGKHVIVEKFEREEVTPGGIIVSPLVRESNVQYCRVVSIGPDTDTKAFKAGDVVVVNINAGLPVKDKDREFHIFRESQIKARAISNKPKWKE